MNTKAKNILKVIGIIILVIVLTLAAGTWILGRIWYVGFLFPAFFALPISTVTRRAMGKAGLLPEEDDE